MKKYIKSVSFITEIKFDLIELNEEHVISFKSFINYSWTFVLHLYFIFGYIGYLIGNSSLKEEDILHIIFIMGNFFKTKIKSSLQISFIYSIAHLPFPTFLLFISEKDIFYLL